MLSYGDVRAWRPEPLVDAEQRVDSEIRTLVDLSDELSAAARPPWWHGLAADAASMERDRIADRLEHTVAGLAAARAALTVAATGVSEINRVVSEAERQALAEGFVIDDSGSVTDGGTSLSLSGLLARALTAVAGVAAAAAIVAGRDAARLEVAARVRGIVSRAEEIDDALAAVLGRVERGEITDGSATSLVAAARAGAAQGQQKPALPGPPPDPPTDPGAGEHGAEPVWSRGDDLVVKALLRDAALVAHVLGLRKAAAFLNHYLGNSGADVRVDLDTLMRDLPRFRGRVEATTVEQMRRLAEEAARDGRYGQPTRFSSGWSRDDLIDDASRDWFYAIGTLDYSVTGVATVHPPDRPGGPPSIEMDYQTHVFDRYNFDKGKATEYGPVDYPVDRIRALHRAGVAQEFDTVGSSEVKRYVGPVP